MKKPESNLITPYAAFGKVPPLGVNQWIVKGQNGNVVKPSIYQIAARRRRTEKAGKKPWW